MKWYDYLVAGFIPITFGGFLALRAPELYPAFIGYLIFWYFFFLGLMFLARALKLE